MKIILSLLIASFSTAVFGKSLIEVRSEVYVEEVKSLILADLAEFKEIDPEYERLLGQIPIGQSPQVGEQIIYTSQVLSSALRKTLNSIPKEAREDWSIKIPSSVKVINRGYVLSSESVEERLKKNWQTLCEDCRILLVNLITPQIPKNLQKFPWELRMSDTLPRGQFAIPVEVKDATSNPHLFWVKGQAEVRRQVPVTTRAIRFGERLSELDFELQWKDVTFAYDSAPSPGSLIGRKVNRSLRNDEVIWNGILEREKAMKRGDLVRVILSESNWQVTLQAVAEEDGFVGDTIRVRNSKSQKLLSGLVTADGEVLVR